MLVQCGRLYMHVCFLGFTWHVSQGQLEPTRGLGLMGWPSGELAGLRAVISVGWLLIPPSAQPFLFKTGLWGEGNGTPLQYSCLENPMDGGAWWAAVHGVAGSRTQLSNFPFTFRFHALEKEMATHSSVLAWRIPGMGKPGGLPTMGSHRVGHNWSDLAAWGLQTMDKLLNVLLALKNDMCAHVLGWNWYLLYVHPFLPILWECT